MLSQLSTVKSRRAITVADFDAIHHSRYPSPAHAGPLREKLLSICANRISLQVVPQMLTLATHKQSKALAVQTITKLINRL